jgi:histidinol-phosphatase (PHP family)
MEESVLTAIDRGLSQIGFADHLPLVYDENPDLSMSPALLPDYVEEVLRLKSVYADSIAVLLGIEADYHGPTMEERVAMLESFPFEYVIGSIHLVGDWMFDDPRTTDRYLQIDIDRFYLEYLDTVEEMILTGLYDIVGHLDLVKKFNHRPRTDLGPHYREVLQAAKESGMCYEVNTAGLRWPAAEMYPEPAVVRLGAELGVPVTMGSDSHCPEDVGRDLDLALDLILESGYREVATFSGGKMKQVPVSDVTR